MNTTVLIIATMDTKGAEAGYLRSCIRAQGADAIIMDTGLLGEPGASAEISRSELLRYAGEALEELVKRGDKGACIRAMMQGAAVRATELFREDRFHGVVGIGGAQGTDIATAAMRELPFGVPKFMVSTIACGGATFGAYVGTRDIVMMHSVADIQGLNPITRTVLSQAAAAVVAMAKVARDGAGDEDEAGSRWTRSVAVSMLGTTTAGALRAKQLLEKQGYEFVAFHQNGTGGIAMEEMIADDRFCAVLDMNLHEIGDRYFGGLHGAIRDFRLETAGRKAVPQVVAPGSINYTVQGPYETLPERLKQRKLIVHNPNLTLVRLSPDELREVAHVTANKLNASRGPVSVFVPLRGFCQPDCEGGPLWEPEGNAVFVEALRSSLGPGVSYREIDAHINDADFVDTLVESLRAFVNA